MSPEEKYAEKIAALLAKAESTTFQAEADAFIAKAQELMTQYAISEAMLDSARGVERDEIEQRTFTYGGFYASDKGGLTWPIVRANGCRGVYMNSGTWGSTRTIGDKTFKMWYELTVTGFRSDLDRVSLLEASLQLQMAQALNEWWKLEDRSWMSKTENVRARRSFMEGFTHGVQTKLYEATKAGREAAARDEAARTNTTEDQATESVALVLRSRKDRVDDWMDKHYGTLRAGRSSYRQSNSLAQGAGRAAGTRANIGQPGVGSRKGLNR